MIEILIVGYGNIGKHMYEEFEILSPDIYDPNIKDYSAKSNKTYDYAFICVPTDALNDGGCDTSVVERAVFETDADLIIIKSTVSPGTTDRLIRSCGKKIVFSPENYGVTQHCKAKPEFVILGGDKELRDGAMRLYGEVKNGYYKFYFTNAVTAELWKYMLNSFLALKVTFCCEFADIAKMFDVSYPELRELFVADDRVGASHTFVYPDRPYYDSHCFNKDIPALVSAAGVNAPLMTFVDKLNKKRKKYGAERTYLGAAPANLVRESELVRQARLRKQRAGLLNETCKTNFRYYCSLCLIIRDENEYLEEWLRWHIGQGVEHFYIYDHGSKQPVNDFVAGLGADIADKTTIIEWYGKHKDAQPDAYNDCLRRFRGESRWIGFLDADEHIRVQTGRILPEFLKGYEEYAGVFAVWVTYNANGMVRKTGETLRKRFTKVCREDYWANKAGKVIVQPLYMTDMVIHNGRAADGFSIVDAHKKRVRNYSLTTEFPTTDLICVDHYYTKSYEEWMTKLRRGSGHAKYQRKYDEFFRVNPDMEYCRESVDVRQNYEQFE